MPFWDRFIKQVKRTKIGFAGNSGAMPPERDLRGYLGAYGELYSIYGIALRIATAVSEVKWRLYKGNERSERSQIASHPILTLLDYANEFQTGQEIIELTQLQMDLAGRAYWYLPKNGLGVPGEIWVLPPHLVKIVPSEKEFIVGYTYTNGSEKIPLGKDEIIRFPLPDPLNPYGGIGYVQASAIEIDSEVNASKWTRNFFYNSARADAALEVDRTLSDDEFKRLRLQWATEHGGLSNAHKIAILEDGVKYKQIQMSQKDMDFVQLRKMGRENLLFAFGIPQSVMGVSENVNRANAEAGDYIFARWLIKPRLTRIRNKLNEQLLPKFKTGVKIEIDFDEVVPETVDQKKALAESGVRSGWMTVNEARKLNNLDPAPNGDIFLVPLNMIPTPAKGKIKPPPEQPKTKLYEEQKAAIWQMYITKAENYEKPLIKALNQMFSEQEKEALKKLRAKPTPLIDLKKAKQQFIDAATPSLTGLIRETVSDALDLIEPEHGSKRDDPATMAALTWMRTRIGWAAEEVGEETARLLADTLAIGYEAGESMPHLATRVRSTFDFCSRSRAIRIARTETITAANEGALKGYEASGVVDRVEFFPAPGACDDCLDLVGEYPIGESHGMIAVHPNCKCIFLPVV